MHPDGVVSGGALTSVVEAFGPLAESVAAQYIYQLVQGLVYLHDQGIVHRDIKVSLRVAECASSKEQHAGPHLTHTPPRHRAATQWWTTTAL